MKKSVIDRKTDNELKCLCGACAHDTYNKKCLYNKILEADDPALKQYTLLKKLIENVVKSK